MTVSVSQVAKDVSIRVHGELDSVKKRGRLEQENEELRVRLQDLEVAKQVLQQEMDKVGPRRPPPAQLTHTHWAVTVSLCLSDGPSVSLSRSLSLSLCHSRSRSLRLENSLVDPWPPDLVTFVPRLKLASSAISIFLVHVTKYTHIYYVPIFVLPS